jgi:predicted XRE-type DNA-binding protein
MSKILEDVWKFVEKKSEDECWLWSGHILKNYGKFFINGYMLSSHRVVYELVNGKIPDGMLVCHTCDIPLCHNPNHLFLGTHKDNTFDMIKKGRQNTPKGENAGLSKLKESDIINIRSLYATGLYFQKEIAELFKVDSTAISRIVNKKRWRHIEYPEENMPDTINKVKYSNRSKCRVGKKYIK